MKLILEARNFLKKSQHENCFDSLNLFFEDVSRNNTLHNLRNHLNIIQTRYFHLQSEKRLGTISYENYNLTFNQISEAL